MDTAEKTTKQLLEELNAARAAAGMPTLASWKQSRDKLLAQLAALSVPATEPDRVEPLPPSDLGSVAEEPQDAPQDAPEEPQDAPSDPTSDEKPIKPERGAVKRLTVELLMTDLPYSTIAERIRAAVPGARTTPRSLASVARDMRADGVRVPSRRP